jgi:hypothetical protein
MPRVLHHYESTFPARGVTLVNVSKVVGSGFYRFESVHEEVAL